MNRNSRTYNVVSNAKIALFCQIFYIILSFICRTIFIKLLGADYLGINGLFCNILTILSFAELGLGNALVYRMYKPIAENDIEKLKTLLRFYKKVYCIICIIMTVAGLLVIPFLKYLVEAPDVKESITVIYTLFLANTISSYVYVYKKSIFMADQKNYVILIYQQVFNVILNVAQIITLLIAHNYIVYLLLMILCNILNNVFCSRKAEHDYPFIKDKSVQPLSESEKKRFFVDVKGLIFQKFGSVILDGTDNIVISALLGVVYVGYTSNYCLLLSTINTLLNRLISSFSASVGNLNVFADKKKELNVFNKVFFLNSWIYGYTTVGFLLLLNEFIGDIWLSSDYILPFNVVIAVVLQFYINGVHYPMYMFRVSTGYFSQLKFAPVIAAITNITLDIILCKAFGLVGIYLATIISIFCITEVADIIIVYKKEFKTNPILYYLRHLGFDTVYVILYIIIK